MEPADSTEPIEPAEPNDPIEPAEHAEKADATEPTEPTESTEPTDPIERMEFRLRAREWSRARPSESVFIAAGSWRNRPIPISLTDFMDMPARPMTSLRYDVHQHLWPEPFLAALERRTEPPFLRRTRDGLTLVLAGEPEAPFDPAPHDAGRRREALDADGIDRALVCLSSPLGVETLPRRRGAAGPRRLARRGVRARRAVRGLGRGRARRRRAAADVEDAAGPRRGRDLAARRRRSRRPEGASACRRSSPRSRRAAAPLLVHPGAAPGGTPALPWWPACVGYVAELHAAWHGFDAWARPGHETLRVVFVALAGGAPLHVERSAAAAAPRSRRSTR